MWFFFYFLSLFVFCFKLWENEEKIAVSTRKGKALWVIESVYGGQLNSITVEE